MTPKTRAISRPFPLRSYDPTLPESCRRCSGTGYHGSWGRESKCDDCGGTGVDSDYCCAHCEGIGTPEKPLVQCDSHLYWTGNSEWCHADCWDAKAERAAELSYAITRRGRE